MTIKKVSIISKIHDVLIIFVLKAFLEIVVISYNEERHVEFSSSCDFNLDVDVDVEVVSGVDSIVVSSRGV